MNKIIGYIFPVLLLIIFVFIMNSSDFIKDKNMYNYINLLNERLLSKNWDKANINFMQLKNTWNKNIKLLQFSVERSELRNINEGIARLKGAISARDKSAALIELNNIKEIWMNLGD